MTYLPILDGDDIEVVLTRHSPFSGAIVDSDGTPVLRVPVTMIGAAHDPAAPRNRDVHEVSSDDEGRLSIPRVPAGRYVGVIRPAESTTDIFEPEELARLESEGTPFTIAQASRAR